VGSSGCGRELGESKVFELLTAGERTMEGPWGRLSEKKAEGAQVLKRGGEWGGDDMIDRSQALRCLSR
jgi:hypothetical protein